MARVTQKDPLDRFRWTIEIDGFTRVGFSSCSTPGVTYNTRTYAEGGAHLFPKQIIDSASYKPVVLTRGVTADQSFHDWIKQIPELTMAVKPDEDIKEVNKTFDTINKLNNLRNSLNPFNRPIEPIRNGSKTPLEYRRDVIIKHKNRAGATVKIYTLHNAIPVEYVPASDFSADGDDTLSMERLVLHYESFTVTSEKQDNNPTDVKGIFKRAVRKLF